VYDIRYSTTLTDCSGFNFSLATGVTGEPAPKVAGSAESFDVTGLAGETSYCWGMRTLDEVPNVSGLSNVIMVTTASLLPSAVTNLSALGATATSIDLEWFAPFDDGGPADGYDVRYSTSPIDKDNFASATQATGEPAPGAPGSLENMTVSGLNGGTLHYFALKVLDSQGPPSAISNVVNALTLDVVNPGQVTDFAASVTQVTQEIAATAISSSGDLNANYGKDKAVDSLLSTSWSTPPRDVLQTETLVVDAGSANNLARVRICARDVAGALFPQDFQIQISLDNVSYTTVVTQTNFVAANGACYPFDFTPQSARYVRLQVTKSRLYTGDNKYYVQLAELEVYERHSVSDRITLNWTAPGDDGAVGTAESYDVRYSINPITTLAEFNAATPASGEPAPHAAGTAESFTVTGLGPGTTYFVRLRTADESGNVSVLSNSTSATTGSP
jgi:hypothetical protein